MPPPELQWEVRTATGRYFADFAWPELRTIGEFDGMVKYEGRLRPGESPSEAVKREKLREDAIRDVGGKWSGGRGRTSGTSPGSPTGSAPASTAPGPGDGTAQRWPGDTLRVAVEDALGAGAIAAALGAAALSVEAALAAAQFTAVRDRLREVLASTSSGRELVADGYAADVVLAAQHDVSRAAPRLVDGVLVGS